MPKILIADDECPIRRILSALLQERGHEVAGTGSGEEALAVFPSVKPDLVLLDLKLPGIDGLETLRRLRALDSRLDVIMMTASGSISSTVEAMRRGALDCIAKPFENGELMVMVDRALEMRRFSSELEPLRKELSAHHGFSEIIGTSRELQEVFRMMHKVLRVDVTVLVSGESGTGKELVARAIHRRSARAQGPFVAVNCSAIPQTLIESEFFGYEKGAFTGARESRPGKFEQADGGTLFLDEVGDLALDAQAKLLRALQERQIYRVGGRTPRAVDIRVLAATNKDLEKEFREGRFREDLYWRLNVVHVRLPPLRERSRDLSILIDHFLSRFNREFGLSISTLTPEARQLLCEYDWPGNIRELENTLCRAMILCEGDVLTAADLPDRVRGVQRAAVTSAVLDLYHLTLGEAVAEATERLERMMILARLAEHRGSRTATAESLGVSRKTLFNKMRQYRLTDEAAEEEDLGQREGRVSGSPTFSPPSEIPRNRAKPRSAESVRAFRSAWTRNGRVGRAQS